MPSSSGLSPTNDFVEIFVPAKAMLFGEYGVLEGGSALVATLSSLFVHMRMRVTICSPGLETVTVRSSFFSEGQVSFFLANELLDFTDRDIEFFFSVFSPFSDDLRGKSIVLEILAAFAPNLGLGTSSAIITGVHHLLYRSLSIEKEETLCRQRLTDSLSRIQPRASGYDVAAQHAALNGRDDGSNPSKKAIYADRFWLFRRGDWAKGLIETIHIDNPSGMGLFLATGLYSDTARVVEMFSGVDKALFALEHRALAERFLANPSTELLPELFFQSRQIAREQGILPKKGDSGKFSELCNLLDAHEIPWKSMGAGGGDSLWVLSSRNALQGIIHPVTGRSLGEAVVFDFATWCKGRSV